MGLDFNQQSCRWWLETPWHSYNVTVMLSFSYVNECLVSVVLKAAADTVYVYHMMTSSNGNIFRVTGHLCGEFTGPRWIPRTKASDTELWFFSLIWARMNVWVNNREAGDMRSHRAHYDVTVMLLCEWMCRICGIKGSCYHGLCLSEWISEPATKDSLYGCESGNTNQHSCQYI